VKECPWCPSEYSVYLLDLRRCRRGSSSSGIGRSFRVFGPLRYRPYWLGHPASPLALAPTMRFSHNGFRWVLLSVQSNPLFELHLPLECYPDAPTRPAAANRILSWALSPYSTQRIEGPLDAGLPARYVPPSGFGYPLDGFLPSIPCRFCFAPAALMGFTLRRFLLSEGIRNVSARMSPLTVQPSGLPAAEAPDRPDRPRLLGFYPSESPWRYDRGLARQSLEPPLGFALPGYSREDLD
jgi:hypothetical protein